MDMGFYVRLLAWPHFQEGGPDGRNSSSPADMESQRRQFTSLVVLDLRRVLKGAYAKQRVGPRKAH